MNDTLFNKEVETALQNLRDGHTILYPTDTVWGIGCDATDEAAISKIFRLKKRDDSKSMIVLLAEEKDILQYVAAPDNAVFQFLSEQKKPTTIIFENAIGLPPNLIAKDGSVAIRLVKDDFCRHILKRLKKPLISTSANISGEPTPQLFSEISDHIKKGVDHVVQWRQGDETRAEPSQIVKWNANGSYHIIRP